MALLDWNGAGMEKYTYDAFGKPKITDWNGNERPVSNFGNRFMYTGRDWIAELGIYDYRNRMYLPELGRFLQADPIGFDAGDMNLFRYCGDDPVDRSDPMGLEEEKFGPGQQELAVDMARSQIEAANSDPGRKLVSERITQKGGYQKTIRYYPSKMVPVFHNGKGYQLGKIVDGRPYTVNGVTFELEFAKESGRRVAVLVHAHNDVRGGKKGDRPGIAQAGWSPYDEAERNIDRMDESRPGVWHSRRNGKEVPSDRASREKASRGAGRNSSNGVSGSSTDAVSSGPTARDIDFAHQSTGVPSLGAEAVNFAPGKP
jgi:RHS repeat-associated protein